MLNDNKEINNYMTYIQLPIDTETILDNNNLCSKAGQFNIFLFLSVKVIISVSVAT